MSVLGLAWQHVGLSAGGTSSLSAFLTPWGNRTWGKWKRATTSFLQRPWGWPVGQEHHKGHVPCNPGSKLSSGLGTSMLARNDHCHWLWNGALFTYPLWGASKTRTCKSDNNQGKASSNWFVKRRPWATVLSAIHRSLKSMEFCLQLHPRESGSFYLDCGKLLNNNMEANFLILGFATIPNLDQVHPQVLNHRWCLKLLKGFESAAGRSQAKISIFSWDYLSVPSLVRTWNRQEEFELPQIIWRVKQTFMSSQFLPMMEPETEWQIQDDIHAQEKRELQLDHWWLEGTSLSKWTSEMQRRVLAGKKIQIVGMIKS